MNLFSRKKKGPDTGPDSPIRVIRQTEPGMCGGTDATLDTGAPTTILSEDMILFDVTSALNEYPSAGNPGRDEPPLGYLSAFAAPAGDGPFLLLETGEAFARRAPKTVSWALVKKAPFPALAALVREFDLAKSNGYHSTTHGLPENFGGSVTVRYAGGETISFSDNQTPVLPLPFAKRVAVLFTEAMKGEKTALPDLSALTEIRFAEERKNGGFTRAVLTVCPDGTGVNRKTSRYDDPTVYESEKPVDAETVGAIRNTVERTGLLAWSGLPDSEYRPLRNSSLTFVFENGTEITVPNGKTVPDPIRDGFFNVELEMTTKH